MLLTKRSGDIIRVLIRFPQDKPVTTAIISDELHISSRSIQRELPTVEKWLTAKGFRFVRKRSVGLFLDEPDDRRRELLTLLDATGTDIHPLTTDTTVSDNYCTPCYLPENRSSL